MRFNGLLLCNISEYFSPSKHRLTKSVFHIVDSYGRGSKWDQRKLFTKVSPAISDQGNSASTCSPPVIQNGKSSYETCSQLESCGLHTIRELLSHFPRTYAELQNAQITINDGQYLNFIGKVISSREIKASCSLSFLEVIVSCEVSGSDLASAYTVFEKNNGSKRTIFFHLKKFFSGTQFMYQPSPRSLQEKPKAGDIVCGSGTVRSMLTKDHYEITEYSLGLLEDADDDESACAEGMPYPTFFSKGGDLNPQVLGEIITSVLDALPLDIDSTPKNILQMFGLKYFRDACIGIHQPLKFYEADLTRERNIFNEFFYQRLANLFQMLDGLDTRIENEKDGLFDKYRNPATNAVLAEEWCTLTKQFLNALPFSLTSSQISAVSEIIWDLKRLVPMNRLLQGDVGCGKTVVAFLACMEVIGSGYQAAFMVPTELLAIQHHDQLLNLLENMKDVPCKPSIALLTSSTPAKKARQIHEGLQSGEIALVIGTHSLIADKVEFSSLRIAVVDEQHRFGVTQRDRFNSKLYCNVDEISMAPHVLAMTATPIPRTLALALYVDMSLTQITDLPPGRKSVDTFAVEGNETGFDKVYQMMKEELESGGRVFMVYPIIDQSERLPQLRGASTDLEVISTRFEGINCGLLHGRMKSDEKDEALRRFRSGETQILLSTQVIEVGVDVPEASMMIVMNAERFGIAQLHQLRGRVGRGTRKSKCVLLSSTTCGLDGLDRLEEVAKSSDGFHLAKMDLLARGPGDLLGLRQSGHLPEFPVDGLEVDGKILQDAHLAALTILSESHNLEEFPTLLAELSVRQRFRPTNAKG